MAKGAKVFYGDFASCVKSPYLDDRLQEVASL